MTRPDPDVIARAVAAASRLERSVRDDPEHLRAVLHDLEPSLRPDQLRLVIAMVHRTGAARGGAAVHDAVTPGPDGSPTGAPTVLPPTEPPRAAYVSAGTTRARPPADPPLDATRPSGQPPKPPAGRHRRGIWFVVVAAVVVAAVALLVWQLTGRDGTPAADPGPAMTATPVGVSPGPTSAAGTPVDAAVPGPFTSAVLYERFAHPFFTPAQCYSPRAEPDRPGTKFPLALPDKELVNCSSPAAGASFWCKDTLAELRAERRHYLRSAVPGSLRVEHGTPAGFRAPADVERSFLHTGLPGTPARVYWESTSLKCAAELQAGPGVTRSRLVTLWLRGR